MYRKNRWKRGIALSLVLALIVTMWPAGVFNHSAIAAPGDRTGKVEDFVNFILDTNVRNDLGTAIGDSTLPKQNGQAANTNTHFYRYNKGSLSVSGSTNGIKTTDPVFVKVEQLILDGSTWRVAADLGNSTLIIDPTDTRRFSGTISLRDGMHRLTFTGKASDGISTITEIMYVRFDSNIVLNSMNLMDGNNLVPMDGIVPSVSSNNVVMVEVKATNATRVVLNGREYAPYGSDTFLVGPINLVQGKNTLNFRIENREGTQQNYTREVYLYDPSTLFVDGEFDIPTSTGYKNAFNSIPGFAVDLTSAQNGVFRGKLLVPYSGSSEAAAIQENLNNDNTTTINKGTIGAINVNGTPELLRGPSGMNYAIYTVNIPFTYSTPMVDNEIGTLRISSGYVSTSNPSNRAFSFRVLDQNKSYITQVSYKPTIGNKVALSPSVATKIASGDTNTTTFEIELTRSVNSGRPYSIITPYNTYTGNTATTGSVQSITLSNLPSGEYNIRFSVDGSDYVDGRILIDTTPSIVFKDYADGITLDHTYLSGNKSIELELVNIKGGNNIGNSSLFVNGNEIFTIKAGQQIPAATTPPTSTNIEKEAAVQSNQIVTIDGSGVGAVIGTISSNADSTRIIVNNIQLRRGENTFEFTLFKDGKQFSKRTISFFIEDSRTPRVTEFKPVLIPKAPAQRIALNNSAAWADSDGISYSKQTGNHTMNDEQFDLLIQAYDVKQLELVMNGQTVYTYQDTDTNPNTTANMDGKIRTVGYDINTTDNNRLTLRFQDLDFKNGNIHTFVLKVVNKNGSMATLPMEIRREVLPYLIKSPVPTVGKDIIVNRNYVPIYIKAENADEITIGKEKAVYNKTNDWFEYTYIGLKENKWNTIKFTVVRGQDKVNGEIKVFYSNTTQPGASILTPISNNIKAINGVVNLKFSKGTILRGRETVNNRKPLYEGHNLLIGIADQENGLIESTKYDGSPADIHAGLRSRYASLPNTFVPVSPIVYINGGLGEAVVNSVRYEPIKNGLQPHDLQYAFTDPLINNRALEPSQRGQLILTFDDSVRNQASTIVTIFKLDQDGRWRNIGGVVNKNTITVPFDEFGYYVAMKWRGSFEDASNHPWARNSIETMYAKGYMNGKQQGVEFGTIDPVTRGEFAQLLVKALDLPINAAGTPTFIDVGVGFTGRSGSMAHEEAVWEYKYIETAARAGIVRGYAGNIFLPNKSLTREEAALMLASALNLKMAKNDSKLRQSLLNVFQDADKASFYSRPGIMAVFNAKIMEGGKAGRSADGKKQLFNFYPTDTLTRAEAAVMISRLLKNQLKKLPKDFDTTNPNGLF